MHITNSQVAEILSMPSCIEVMKELFSFDMGEDLINPLRTKMDLPGPIKGLLGLMPAFIKPYNIMGVKILSVFADNYKIGISSHQGIIHLFETKTGKLLASIDADELTATRTAAVSALVTDFLAIEKAATLCIIGSGQQARKHMEAMFAVRDINKVNVWGTDTAGVKNFIAEVKLNYKADFRIYNSANDAAIGADIICTVTSSKQPLLSLKYLSPSVHINAVGACTPNSRELETDIIASTRNYVDSYESAVNESGDLLIPANELHRDAATFITGNISQLVSKNSDDEKLKQTVFVSLGLAIEDIAAGYYCYKRIKRN